MAVIEIIQFATDASVIDSSIEKAVNGMQGVKTPKRFVIGTHIQDKSAVQVTAEWDKSQDNEKSNSSAKTAFIDSLRTSLGSPTSVFHTTFNTGSTFANSGPATSNVIEYVQIWFPVSRINADFQQQIEQDFVKFDQIFNKAGPHAGQGSLAYGWVQEEQTHADIPNEKARCFFVTRGWEAMSGFEQSVQTEAYKEAIPILIAWGAPFKMVSSSARCSEYLRLTCGVVACRASSWRWYLGLCLFRTMTSSFDRE